MKKAIKSITTEIEHLLSMRPFVIMAIDGACTAGKTTLAAALSDIYDCNVFHMDDFFLRSEQRTKERLSEVGGNIDYERFREEVVLPLRKNKPFKYQPYDCHTKTFKGSISVVPRKLNIIEGTYCLHPSLAVYYDYTIYLKIHLDKQRERILLRNPELHKRFMEEWIPMEQQYFSGSFVTCRSDMVIDTSNWK